MNVRCVVAAALVVLGPTTVWAQNDEAANESFFEAIDAYGAKKYTTALKHLAKAERRATDSLLLARIHRQRGLAENGLGKRLEAVVSFMRALSYRPDIKVSEKEHGAKLVELFECASRIRALGVGENQVARKYGKELRAKRWVCPVQAGAAVTREARRRAKGHDSRARKLQKQDDLEGAIAQMIMALGFDRAPRYLKRTAELYEAKGDLPNAIRYLKEYANGVEAKKRPPLKKKIAALEARERKRLATGTLVLDVNLTGADVEVDGEQVGKTPLSPLTLTVGNHSFVLTAPDYLRYEGSVTVQSAERKTLRVKMTPRPKTGNLVVAVPESGARLRVDGRDVGIGPLQRSIELPVGAHEVVVQKDSEFLPFTGLVEIRDGETTQLLVQLEAVPEIESPSAWGWVLLVSGGLMAGGGAAFTVLAGQERRTLDGTIVNPEGATVGLTQVQAQEAEDRGDQYASYGAALFVGAGAAVIGGTLIAIFTGGDPVAPKVRAGVANVYVGPESVGLSVAF